MGARSRLTVATASDLQATTRQELRKGVLKSDFLPGPSPSTVRAGSQPLGSGLHYDRCAPILVQFPAEILSTILSSLDPIWLFQVEAAFPAVARYLRSSQASKIWYEALPAALFVEPEAFQDEEKNARSQQQCGYSDVLIPNETAPLVSPTNIPNDSYYYPQVIDDGLIFLPHMDGLSEIACQVNWSCDINHPLDVQYYPYISTDKRKMRIRNLAIGGPFQPSLKYRRELLGHLHYGKRCNVCFEVFTNGSRFRTYKHDWGMKWCEACLAAWTVAPGLMDLIPGLRTLIRSSVDKSVLAKRVRNNDEDQWLPLMDEIVRGKVGLDFETAFAKQQYIEQISQTLLMRNRPIDVNRLLLRGRIVRQAQARWQSGQVPLSCQKIVESARKTFAPHQKLAKFLFAPQKLSTTPLCEPRDEFAVWIKDPTMDLTSNFKIESCDHQWVFDQTSSMITALVLDRKVTAWNKAADAYHVWRIKQAVTADKILLELGRYKASIFDRPYSHTGTPKHLRRLEVILTKLHVHNVEQIRIPFLNEYQRQMAKDHFRKIAFAACIGCPQTSFLALPRGIEGIVKHFRESHATRYWTEVDWTIIG